MNKYLEKVAQMISDENKAVLRTVGETAAMSTPAHAAGAWIGNKVGAKYGKPGIGTFVGGAIAGGIADVAAVKHSLHGKVKKQ